MQISSSAFTQGNKIPDQYTCTDENISPPLGFLNIPEGTESLALIVDDPDAPSGTFTHWVVFNIPPSTKTIEEGASPEGIQGKNDFNRLGYGGPCPPSGVHRYFFKLFALDITLDLDEGATKVEVEHAMEGHIIIQSTLMGVYEK